MLRRLIPIILATACALGLNTTVLYAEWGAEISAGGNPTAYYNENLQKQNSSYQMQISGVRHALNLTGKIYYEWIGARFWSDTYFSETGAQKTQTNSQTNSQTNNSTTSEQDGVGYSRLQNFRGELQLRKFSYGHREVFAFNFGLLYRTVASNLDGQPADYVPVNLTKRYLTLGISVEPLLTNFGRYELSLPLELSIGLNFPDGGIFGKGAGLGAVLLAAGVRLQQEPRGVFITAQGCVNFHDMSFSAAGADYSFGQTEVTLKIAAGYYFKSTVYNE